LFTPHEPIGGFKGKGEGARGHDPPKLGPTKFQERLPGAPSTQENLLAAGDLSQTHVAGAYNTPPDPLAGRQGAGCPPPQEPHTALGHLGSPLSDPNPGFALPKMMVWMRLCMNRTKLNWIPVLNARVYSHAGARSQLRNSTKLTCNNATQIHDTFVGHARQKPCRTAPFMSKNRKKTIRIPHERGLRYDVNET